MGVMTEVPAVPEISEAEFEDLAKRYTECKHCKSEVEIDTGLNLIRLYSAVFEEGKQTNGIVNVNKPWDVRVSWCLVGPLRELICGKWCVTAHFESIGKGEEFELHYPEFRFDCHNKCFDVRIKGREVHPDNCSNPYKIVVTVAYLSDCDRPAGILGYCELPIVQFYHA